MTTVDKEIYKRIFSLVAVFLIGNLIIRFPKGEGQEHSFWGYILCFVFSVGVVAYFCRLQYASRDFGIGLFDNTKIQVLLYLFILICFLICCKDYIIMLNDIRLREIPKWLLAAVYLIVVFILALTKKQVIYFFSFTNAILIALGFVAMFLFSLGTFNIDFLKQSINFNAKNVINQALTFYIHSFGQVLLCMLFIGHIKKQDTKNSVILGVLLGGTLLLICFLNVILMVGSDIVDELNYPYASVTAMLVSADGYNRMDVITYYIYFICNLLKSTVLLKLILNLANNRITKMIIASIALILSLVFSSITDIGALLQSRAVNFVLLCLEVFFAGYIIFKVKISQKSH